MNPQHLNGSAPQARALRRLAASVLRQLLNDRDACEQHLAERGRTDPIKTVTGRSSIDQAVQRTRAIIERMDQLLREADAQPSSNEADADALNGAAPAIMTAQPAATARERPTRLQELSTGAGAGKAGRELAIVRAAI